MQTDSFDYDLPAELIAQRPIERRDRARLLVDRGGGVEPAHRVVADLATLLSPGDLVVVNDTRVLPARLHLRKETGGAVEVLLLEPLGPLDAPPGDRWDAREAGSHTGEGVSAGATIEPGAVEVSHWEALVRPSRRVPPGTILTSARPTVEGSAVGRCTVEVGADLGDGRRHVQIVGPLDAARAIDELGEVPLPPYITAPLVDPERYQTVYADRAGSAAAPTAGLHFTPELLAELEAAGIGVARVELRVGLDTFRPITAARIEDHEMHSEAYVIPDATWDAIERTHRAGGQVVAVGTTTLRALESAALLGVRAGRTDLFIHAPHTFHVVDRLLTNFHLPKSSLLVLIDAFVGPRWRSLYDIARHEQYRFLSFGDAMLLTRSGPRAGSV